MLTKRNSVNISQVKSQQGSHSKTRKSDETESEKGLFVEILKSLFVTNL